MGLLDNDLEQAEELKKSKKERDKDFNKVINKKKLNDFEMDEMFCEE